MPKHVCRAWLLPHGLLGHRCAATAMKTKRGAWRCRLHGGLSPGPTSPEGKARIVAAARARWAAHRQPLGIRKLRVLAATSKRKARQEPSL
jgi:hypothetical protein